MNATDKTVHHAMTNIIIPADAIIQKKDNAKITETTDTMSTGITDVKTLTTANVIIAEIADAMSTKTVTATTVTCGGDKHIFIMQDI